MVFREDIGNITQSQVFKKYFKWTVANFLSFLHDRDTHIISPTFQFQCQQCVLELQTSEYDKWIGIRCWISPKSYLNRVRMGVLAPDCEEYRSFAVEHRDDDPMCHLYEQQRCIEKSELYRVLHSGQLKVFFEIVQEDSESLVTTDSFDGK